MNAYLPYTKLGAAGTVNIGTGGLTIFLTMLIQRGESLYNKEFNATNLASPISVEAFKFWTEFYTDYSLDQDANFFQKFRRNNTHGNCKLYAMPDIQRRRT